MQRLAEVPADVQAQVRTLIRKGRVPELRSLIQSQGWTTNGLINRFGVSLSSQHMTLLHQSCCYDYVEMVSMLCEDFGADVNIATNDREAMTPVMVAAYFGKLPVVKYLCATQRADILYRSPGSNETVMDIARKRGGAEMVEYLQLLEETAASRAMEDRCRALEQQVSALQTQLQRAHDEMKEEISRVTTEKDREIAALRIELNEARRQAAQGGGGAGLLLNDVYEMFDDRAEQQKIQITMLQLQPKFSQEEAPREARTFLSRKKTERLFHEYNKLNQLIQVELNALRTNPEYLNAMQRKLDSDEFYELHSSHTSYIAAFQASIAAEAAHGNWDDQVAELNALKRVWTRPQPFHRDVFPYLIRIVETQNRVNRVIGVLAELARATDGFFPGKPKSLYRMCQKASLKAARGQGDVGPFDIWDMSRALVSFSSLASLVNCVKIFLDPRNDAFRNITVVGVKPKFKSKKEGKQLHAKLAQDENSGSAWMDCKIHFVFSDRAPEDRILSELQLCLQKFTIKRKQQGGHNAYSKFRFLLELKRAL